MNRSMVGVTGSSYVRNPVDTVLTWESITVCIANHVTIGYATLWRKRKMADYRYESLTPMIKRFSKLRDEYIENKQEQSKRWKELVTLRNEIQEFLKYHGLKTVSSGSIIEPSFDIIDKVTTND
jgi:hypothetical protein